MVFLKKRLKVDKNDDYLPTNSGKKLFPDPREAKFQLKFWLKFQLKFCEI